MEVNGIIEEIDILMLIASNSKDEDHKDDPLHQHYLRQTRKASVEPETVAQSDREKKRATPKDKSQEKPHTDVCRQRYQGQTTAQDGTKGIHKTGARLQLTPQEQTVIDNFGLDVVSLVASKNNRIFRCSNAVLQQQRCQEVAVKITNNQDLSNPYSKCFNEVNILKQLDGLRVTKFVVDVQYPDLHLHVLITEFWPGGTLTDAIKSGKMLNVLTMAETFFSLCRALRNVHDRNIVHRDICTDTILLDACGEPVLSGFSSAVQLRPGDRLVHGLAGTSPFIAPEIEAYRQGNHDGFKADVYAVGMVLGKLLFHCADPAPSAWEMLEIFRNTKLPYESIQDVFKGLMPQMLTDDPESRLTIKEVNIYFFLNSNRTFRCMERLREANGVPTVLPKDWSFTTAQHLKRA